MKTSVGSAKLEVPQVAQKSWKHVGTIAYVCRIFES